MSASFWWAGERPAGLPSAAPVINKVAAEYWIVALSCDKPMIWVCSAKTSAVRNVP
jgi:hypothetical protein